MLVALVSSDRLAVLEAEHATQSYVSHVPRVAGSVDVDISGFPFLTQAADIGHVFIRIGQVNRFGVQLTDVRMKLSGVHPSWLDGLRGDLHDVPVDEVTASASIAYSQLQKRLRDVTVGLPLITLTGDEAGLHLSTPILGALSPSLTIKPTVEAGALELPVPIPDQRPTSEKIRVPLPDLPYGFALESVGYGTSGLRLTMKQERGRLPTR